jgi:hypothetical protein
VFPFNHFDDDTDFSNTITTWFTELDLGLIARLQEHMFNPFDLNDDNLNLPHMDSDPDLQYFNDTTYIDGLNKCDYYLARTFNNMVLDNDITSCNSFSLFHFNIRSIARHANEMDVFLSKLNTKFSVIGLTETWLTDLNCDLYDLDDYVHHKQIRNGKRGGGVSIFAAKNLDSIFREDICYLDTFIEVIFIEIPKLSSGLASDCIIGTVYRPPNTDLQKFNEKLSDILSCLRVENKIIYIMGDFNINILASESHAPTSEFLEDMYSYGLFPVISKPTRMTQDTMTLIDNIFTNDIASQQNYQGIFFTDISDHFPIFLIKSKTKCASQVNTFPRRVINEKSLNTFQYELGLINWSDVITCNDSKNAFQLFHQKYSELYNEIFPLKKSTTELQKP